MIEGECTTAQSLFEDYAKATIEYFEAADNLSNLVRSGDLFVEATRHTQQAGVKCRIARLAIEKHRVEHNCG